MGWEGSVWAGNSAQAAGRLPNSALPPYPVHGYHPDIAGSPDIILQNHPLTLTLPLPLLPLLPLLPALQFTSPTAAIHAFNALRRHGFSLLASSLILGNWHARTRYASVITLLRLQPPDTRSNHAHTHQHAATPDVLGPRSSPSPSPLSLPSPRLARTLPLQLPLAVPGKGAGGASSLGLGRACSVSRYHLMT
jgi:hypothetical protein